MTARWRRSTSATACCSVHSSVTLRGSSPASRTIAANAAASNRGSSRLAGVTLTATRSGAPTVRAAALVQLAGALEDLRDEEHVELDRAVRIDGRLHDRRDRLREHRHVRPEEALVFVQLAAGQLDDRLEGDGVERAQAEEVVERLGLDDLGRLGHADAVRETGHLDGGREGHQVAVRLRQRVVDRDEAVLGCARLPGDRARDELGQLARRARSRSRPSRARGREHPARATRADARTGCRATTAGARRWGGGDWRRGARDSTAGRLATAPPTRRRRARASCPRAPSRGAPCRGSRRRRYLRPLGRLRQALTRTDLEVEAVLRRRERTGPARVERARRLRREIEVEDERPVRRVRAGSRSEVGALRRIDQVAARAVGRLAIGGVTERDEDPARSTRPSRTRTASARRPGTAAGRGRSG